MLRTLRNALLVLATLFVLGFGALLVLATVYETEVKVGLVGALNQRLNAPVTVSDMDLTLVARFPQASMRLNDVLVMEVRSDAVPPDTLLFASALHLEFSLWDLFSGVYTVNEIHAEEVRLYPALDGNGQENYLVWKTDSTAAASPIALEKVSCKDLQLRYRDDRSKLLVSAHSEALSLRGRFSDALNELSLSGDLHLLEWHDGSKVVLADREGELRLALEFGGPDTLFRIIKGELHTGGVDLEVTMAVTEEKEDLVLDLRANGLGLDLERAVMLLPRSMTKDLKRYKMSGEVDLAVHYAGPLESGPSLSIGATVTKGRMRESLSNTTFTDIFAELGLELSPKGVPRKLVIKGLSAKSSSGTLSGNWESNGLTNATVKAELKANIALAELLRFAQVDTLEQVSGRLKADLRMDGKIRDMGDIRATDMRALRVQGSADLRDATLKMKGVRHRVEHLDADLAMQGNDATVQGLKAEIQGTKIQLSGTLRNLMPYLLFDAQHLVIEAKGSSPRVDLAALLRSDEASADTPKDYTLVLPAAIELDLSANVEELVFEDFKATAIKGRIQLHDRVLRVVPMSFSTASGTVSGGLELDGRDRSRPYPLAINATMTNIELKQLFREFQDFGQTFIGHKHLSGRTNAQVAFNAPLSRTMQLDMQRLVCVIDISVDKGAIKGHAPMLQVADHLQKNKLVAPFVDVPQLRKELADIRFDHLENQIEIRDGAVHIPNMLVKSSVMDLELSGTHWFDDRIDHHLNFRLSDLFRKAASNDEFGPVVDDGTGMRVYLHMYGTASDPQFGNDGAMAAAKRKQQLKSEKEELRNILREEFGIFKGKGNEPVLDPKRSDPAAPRFEVEWERTDSAQTAGAQGGKKPRKGLGRLLDPGKEEKPPPAFEVVQ